MHYLFWHLFHSRWIQNFRNYFHIANFPCSKLAVTFPGRKLTKIRILRPGLNCLWHENLLLIFGYFISWLEAIFHYQIHIFACYYFLPPPILEYLYENLHLNLYYLSEGQVYCYIANAAINSTLLQYHPIILKWVSMLKYIIFSWIFLVGD